jgi:hypothetical protein
MTGADAEAPGRGGARRWLLWDVAAVLLGAVNLVAAATLPLGAPARVFLGFAIFLAILAVLILTGLDAARAGLRPSWQAALAAVGYAVPSGLSAVLFPPTLAEVRAELRRAHATPYQLQTAALANTSAAHWSGLVIGVVVFATLGLVAGWVGSLFAGRGPRRGVGGASDGQDA